MTYSLEDLNKKSDEELLRIKNGKMPHFMSAKSTTTPADLMAEADVILHKRQKEGEKRMSKMTLWILILTIVIAVLTAVLVFSEFKKTYSVDSSPKKDSYPEKPK
ncbi:MAG TPA: hypothetical protein PK125_03675 [Syntrophorhabdus sp.]|jgi:hypothetical protein|nr:hypothetical protein [Syntrophaceae bacterium]OPX97678.1 MAG: hypothetical protein A4E59_00659 [Syntrophorhabdus sp. PtaB.Bin027]HPB37240.1 hypothetical protein [Syntrophorhabdus sp.]HPW35940.1 hypothetical protein [Syntrophorhabdus sp.]HQO64340.1 hypothetical protein [Syntrophorhabdus sp.]